MITFEYFKTQVEEAGLQARLCTQYHWQIRGGKVLVNFWPSTNRVHHDLEGRIGKQTLIAEPPGSVHRRSYVGTMEQAIAEAKGSDIVSLSETGDAAL